MANPTQTPPAGGTPPAGSPSHPLLQEFLQTVKKYAGFDLDWNFFLSAGNPEMDADAKRKAEAADKKLKADSFFRGSIAERGLGMLAAALENMGDRQTGILKALFKKGADYLESFGTYFYGHSLKEEAKKHGDDKRAGMLLMKHGKFYDRALKLLSAPGVDTDRVLDKLTKEASGLGDIEKALTSGSPKPTEPKVPFGERVDRFNEIMERELGPAVKHLQQKTDEMNARTRALQAQQRQAAAARQPSKMDSFLKRLSRVLFGFPKPTT